MAMPPGLRDMLRPGLIASAQRICRNTLPDGMPCGDCLYTVSVLHCEFIDILPQDVYCMPRRQLCQEIRSAAQDA